LIQEIKIFLLEIGSGDFMGLYTTIWSILFLGATAIIYQSSNTFGIIFLFLTPIPIIIFTVFTKLIVDRFANMLPSMRVDLDVENYLFPYPNSKEVGITIRNLEQRDLTLGEAIGMYNTWYIPSIYIRWQETE
jgi:hypothetical protein